MFELLEEFDVEDALRQFESLDLRSASSSLLRTLGYSFVDNIDDDDSVEKFIYFSAPNKAHFNSLERLYLNQVSTLKLICEISQNELLGTGYSEKNLTILAVELNCNKSDRSESSYYITQILNKLFNDYVLIIFKHQDNIEFCSYLDAELVYMSDWFNTTNPTYMQIYKMLEITPANITGVKSIKEFYEETSFAFAREYIKRPESYEYFVYECIPKIADDIVGEIVSKQVINEFAEVSKNYYRDIYGDDYVLLDENFVVMEDNEEDWTLFELDDFIPPDAQDELNEEFATDEIDNDDDFNIDYSEIDEETLNDPVKLLELFEAWDKEKKEKVKVGFYEY